MKKALTVVLSIIMGVLLMFGVVACGDKKDNTQTVKDAIDTIRLLYEDEPVETSGNYQVMGRVRVGDDFYDIDWSVSSTTENYQEYVSIGEMDPNADNQCTVTITLGAEAVEYTLRATVTIGKASDFIEFKHTIPAAANVLTVAQAIGKAKGITTSDKYYRENDQVVTVLVKGYVVDAGTWGSYGLNNVYIADEPNGETTLLVYSLNKDDTYNTQEGAIEKGDLVTLCGPLKYHNGNLPELTYYNNKVDPSIQVVVTSLTKPDLSDAEKVANAKAAVDLSCKVYNKVDEYTLLATQSGANLAWAVKGETNLVKVESGKLKIVELPAAKTEVTLTVTISSGSESATKDITISVGPEVTEPATLKASEAQALGETLAAGKYYEENGKPVAILVQGYVVDPGSFDEGKFKKIYIADEKDGTEKFYVFRVQPDDVFLKANGDLAKDDLVTFSGYLQNYSGTIELTYYSKSNVVCVALERAVSHTWSYAHVEGSMTHTRTCTDTGCGVTETVDCTPALNVCPDCKNEYTETEILTALFALDAGKSLPGTYQLTGTASNVSVNTQYGDVTFDMAFGDRTVKAYQAKGDGYETLKDGDVVTVTGTLKHFYNSKTSEHIYEFDKDCTFVKNEQGGDVHVHTYADTWTQTETHHYHEATCGHDVKSEEGTHQFVNYVCTVCGYEKTDKFYTVAEAKAIAAGLAAGAYHEDANGPVAVLVKGYVIDAGSFSTQYNNWSNIYVADSADTAKADALLVYRVVLDSEYLKADGCLENGDHVTFSGYLQNYKGNTPELTFNGDNNVTCVGLEYPTDLNDDGKVQRALRHINLPETVTKAEELALPVSTVRGVELEFTSNDAAIVIAEGKMTVTLPATDTKVTITAKATLTGTETSASQNFEVTVKAPVAGETVVSLALDGNVTTYEADQIVWTSDGITVTNAKAGSATACTNYDPALTHHARIYKNAKMKIECAGMKKIVFHCAAAKYVTPLKNSLGSDYTVTVSGNDVTVEFATACDSLEITASEQFRVSSIDITK